MFNLLNKLKNDAHRTVRDHIIDALKEAGGGMTEDHIIESVVDAVRQGRIHSGHSEFGRLVRTNISRMHEHGLVTLVRYGDNLRFVRLPTQENLDYPSLHLPGENDETELSQSLYTISAPGYTTLDWRCLDRNDIVKYLERYVVKHNGLLPYVGMHTCVAPNRHVMVLDCDATDRMIASCHWLKYIEINYCVVESSPDRYWVITDHITTMDKLIARISSIPGVDHNFVNFIVRNKITNIRAHPKEEQIPTFPDKVNLKRKESIGWLNQLKEWYESPDLERILHLVDVTTSLRDGKIIGKAADPSFVL